MTCENVSVKYQAKGSNMTGELKTFYASLQTSRFGWSVQQEWGRGWCIPVFHAQERNQSHEVGFSRPFSGSATRVRDIELRPQGLIAFQRMEVLCLTRAAPTEICG